jgi:glycosyltransferase involved in cell wall biosynthesis
MFSLDILFLVSHSKEVPSDFKVFNIASIKLNSLLANDLRKLENNPKIICIVTGIGYKNTHLSLDWIKANISTKLIVNLGSCGSSNTTYFQKIVCPQKFSFNNDSYLGLGLFPFLITESSILKVSSCESVKELTPHSNSEITDMESFWHAEFCSKSDITYCSLKFVTDMNDANTQNAYIQNLNRLQDCFNCVIREIFTPVKGSVTVIIPTYNRAKFLKRSIDSVLKQTIKANCIVVDDGSTDETHEILSLYESKIEVIRLAKNGGVSAARNSGILHSNSNWICFLDSDDEWRLDKLKNQLDFHENHPYFSVFQSQENWIRDNKKINKKKHFNKVSGFIWDVCLNRCMISASSVIIRKEVFNKFGLFDKSLPICEDYDLWLRLSRHLLIGLENSFSLNKFAGHINQLSTTYVAMDRFRVFALKKALKNEFNPDFYKKLQDIISAKENVLIKGKLKRGDKSVYCNENLL